MIETRDGSVLRPPPKSVDRKDTPGVFLRFESARERMALPYSLMMKLEMSMDERTLELAFVSHVVTIAGRNLRETYEAITEGDARCIRLSKPDDTESFATRRTSVAISDLNGA